MKKYTSVIALYARATLGKLLALLVLTGLVETGLFYLAMDPALPLEAVFANTHIPLACAVGFGLCVALLTLPAFQKAGYTLGRTQLNLRARYLCHICYNALCFLMFWSFQVCLLVGLFHWFGTRADETMFGPQSILLAFYRTDFLHSLLPLADWTRYLRNVALILGLAAMTARPLTRRGSRGSQIGLVVLTLCAMWVFPAPLTSRPMDWFLMIISLIALGINIVLQDTNEEVEQSAASVPEVPVSSVFQEEVSEDEE